MAIDDREAVTNLLNRPPPLRRPRVDVVPVTNLSIGLFLSSFGPLPVLSSSSSCRLVFSIVILYLISQLSTTWRRWRIFPTWKLLAEELCFPYTLPCANGWICTWLGRVVFGTAASWLGYRSESVRVAESVGIKNNFYKGTYIPLMMFYNSQEWLGSRR